MNKIIKILPIAIIFLLFCIFEIYQHSGSKVIRIDSATEIVVDLNKNGIADKDELICIPNVKTFTADIKRNQNDLIKSLNITSEEALISGYIADKLAKDTLLNQKVRLHFRKEHSPKCKYADIKILDRNYADILEKSGIAIQNNKLEKPENFYKNLESGKKLNLVILNKKSGKYHTLKCKFGLNTSDFEILPEKEVLEAYKKCKFCFKTNKEEQSSINFKDFNIDNSKGYSELKVHPSIKFMLSDYTKHLKPNRNCEHIFCKEVVNLINSTNSTLDMAIYGWSNIPKISEAINSAKKRGVQIRIVYDKKPGRSIYPETEEFIKGFTNKRSDENFANKSLTSMLMHNKFIISDNQKVLTGSMNFSTTGLSGFNANNVLVINSSDIARLYSAEFNQMYEGKFHTQKSKTTLSNKININGTDISIYFSPQDKGIENGILPLIKNAKQYIYIPAFVITHKRLSNALIEAKTRGVDVKLIMDATSTGTIHSTHKLLRESGIPLKFENYAGKIHNKSIIIDDKFVVTGSMNFSNSGENRNDENCLIIEDAELAKFYRGWFEYIWTKIPDKYLQSGISAESKASLGSCTDGIDNDFDGKTDNFDEGCR